VPFQFGAIMNKTVINIFMQVFWGTYIFISLWQIPRKGSTGLPEGVDLLFFFLNHYIYVSILNSQK
jgi:hypothetical protein